MYDEQETKSIEKSLRYIASHVRVNGREILKHHDISPLQFVALQWVGDKDGITIGELATRLYLAHSTTTDIVDKLESGNYVRRDRSDKDKRLVLVSMEKKAKRLSSRSSINGSIILRRLRRTWMKQNVKFCLQHWSMFSGKARE